MQSLVVVGSNVGLVYKLRLAWPTVANPLTISSKEILYLICVTIVRVIDNLKTVRNPKESQVVAVSDVSPMCNTSNTFYIT